MRRKIKMSRNRNKQAIVCNLVLSTTIFKDKTECVNTLALWLRPNFIDDRAIIQRTYIHVAGLEATRANTRILWVRALER